MAIGSIQKAKIIFYSKRAQMSTKKKISISDIVRRCQTSLQDQVAWHALIAYLRPGVLRQCESRGLTHDEANDIIGEAQAELIMSIQNIRNPSAIKSFMHTIVRRSISSMFHNKPKEVRLSPTVLDTLVKMRDSDDPFYNARISELRQALLSAIKQLSNRDQKIIYKCFLETPQQTYKAIEKELRFKPNTLGAYRSKALKRLRRILGDKNSDY